VTAGFIHAGLGTHCRILLTTAFIGSIIAVSWALYDSLYLRFVILFLGTINALYAIWDIYLDGIKYGKTVASDCTAMARKFNNNRLKHVSIPGPGLTWISWLTRRTRMPRCTRRDVSCYAAWFVVPSADA
jgi:hypothetical protein